MQNSINMGEKSNVSSSNIPNVKATFLNPVRSFF
jgi:hypothetical protein